jgi:uncharacterized 2Fe-2S/4Fe-4S cluster protein (DUF4445 family)
MTDISSTTKKIKIHFEPEGRKVEAEVDMTIMKAAQEAGVQIRSECGNLGSCGKCRVIIKDQSNLNKISQEEIKHLTPVEINNGYRLACCSVISGGDFVIFLPPESRMDKRRIQFEGMERPCPLNPGVKKQHLQVTKPTLQDVRPDFERIADCLREKGFPELDIDHELVKNLPTILRSSDWNVTVAVWNNK